jgi:hypothetical protein
MNMVLQYQPGQTVSIWFETLDLGQRSDGYSIPTISRIIFPSLNVATGYPQSMIRYDVGLYYFQFTIPSGAVSVGTYVVDVSYVDPATGNPETTFIQVIVSAPFGLFSVSVP